MTLKITVANLSTSPHKALVRVWDAQTDQVNPKEDQVMQSEMLNPGEAAQITMWGRRLITVTEIKRSEDDVG